MTDYNTMNAQQCADWLEAKDEWIRTTVDGYTTWTRKCHPEVAASPSNFRRTPPYALTLDGAAAALREPWEIYMIRFTTAHVSVSLLRQNTACWKNVHAPDELTARYRAAVAARMEDDK